jgi:hypothetical protein
MPIRRSTVTTKPSQSLSEPVQQQAPVQPPPQTSQIEQPSASAVSNLKSVFEKKPAATGPPVKGNFVTYIMNVCRGTS